jgi:hypothetical protein
LLRLKLERAKISAQPRDPTRQLALENDGFFVEVERCCVAAALYRPRAGAVTVSVIKLAKRLIEQIQTKCTPSNKLVAAKTI